MCFGPKTYKKTIHQLTCMYIYMYVCTCSFLLVCYDTGEGKPSHFGLKYPVLKRAI